MATSRNTVSWMLVMKGGLKKFTYVNFATDRWNVSSILFSQSYVVPFFLWKEITNKSHVKIPSYNFTYKQAKKLYFTFGFYQL